MIEFFMSLIGHFLTLKGNDLQERQAKSIAISALRNAVRLTLSHIEETRVSQFEDPESADVASKEIAAAWSRAAETVRLFNKGMADTLEDKSDFWTNPDRFRKDILSGTRRNSDRMRLENVIQELDEFQNN